MKKILILVDKIRPSNTLLAESISVELNAGDDCTLASFSEVFFHLKNKDVMAYVRDIPITDFNVVHFRTTGRYFMSMAYTIAQILAKNDVRLINTTYNTPGASGDKLTSLTRLTLAGLPTIESLFVWRSSVGFYKDKIEKTLGYPFVTKDRFAQRGVGISLVRSDSQFTKMLEGRKIKSLILQKFVDSKQEFRLLVLGDKVRVFERKTITDKNEFRANVSLGASEEFMPLNKIPKKMERIAIKAANALGLQVAGVDIIEDTKGNYWLLEVNRGPGITHNKEVSPELTQMGKFFAKELLTS